jgi:hypothetical protein
MGMCARAGLETRDKLAKLREALAKADCEALILTALDDIACMADPELPLHGYHVIRCRTKTKVSHAQKSGSNPVLAFSTKCTK